MTTSVPSNMKGLRNHQKVPRWIVAYVHKLLRRIFRNLHTHNIKECPLSNYISLMGYSIVVGKTGVPVDI